MLPGEKFVESTTDECTQPHTDPIDTHDSLLVSCAIILTDEGNGRSIECRDNVIAIIFEVEGRCRSRNCIGTVRVDGRLQQDIREREDHTLQTGRHTNHQHSLQFIPMDTELVQMQAVRLFLVEEDADDLLHGNDA